MSILYWTHISAMDQYNNFGVEDFVWDTFFRQWVVSPTRESDVAWSDWLRNNPGMSEKTRLAREIVLSLRVRETQLSEDEIRRSINQTISRIDRPVLNLKRNVRRQNTVFYKTIWFRIAASFILLSSIGLLTRSYIVPEKLKKDLTVVVPVQEAETSLVKKTNTSKVSMMIELADKSRVLLFPRSTIQYKREFLGERREVFLEGEAFFEVSKDHEHPFFVYANDLVTKVLGTSFRVKAFNGSRRVMVEVKTGRVSVFAKSDPNRNEKTANRELEGVVLSPNQKIIFNGDHSRMVKTLVEEPEIVIPKAQIPEFIFEDVAVNEVFDSIAKAYGIDILYDEDLLRGCPLTAILENQTLHDKLTIICKAIEASYEILDGQIVIHSKGCRN